MDKLRDEIGDSYRLATKLLNSLECAEHYANNENNENKIAALLIRKYTEAARQLNNDLAILEVTFEEVAK